VGAVNARRGTCEQAFTWMRVLRARRAAALVPVGGPCPLPEPSGWPAEGCRSVWYKPRHEPEA